MKPAIASTRSSTRQELDEEIGDLAIRRPCQGHAAEARLVHHRLLFTECKEAFATVVMAHAGRSDAAERQLALGKMQHGVIDGNAARGRALEHALGACAVMIEVIQREWARA